jgi:hypothetical protein
MLARRRFIPPPVALQNSRSKSHVNRSNKIVIDWPMAQPGA